MPASASPARFVAAACQLAVALAAGPADADPAPAVSPSPGPVITQPTQPVPITLDVGVRLGGNARLGDAPASPITARGGAMLGIGVAVAPSPRFAVGLAYEHAAIGSEHGEGDLGVVDIDRALDSLWASIRLTLFRVDRFTFGVFIGPGLVWQTVDANVILYGGVAGRPDLFRCTDTGGPGLGLRAGLGAEANLGGGFYFTLDAVADELRLGSDPIGTCAPGTGSTALLGVRGALSYRFDVSRGMR
jgi:hypothetical protein